MNDICDDILDLPSEDRLLFAWPVTGVTSADVAEISLDDGEWKQLLIGQNQVEQYFAGPANTAPDGAIVVTGTASVEIRIRTATQVLTFRRGFIRVVP